MRDNCVLLGKHFNIFLDGGPLDPGTGFLPIESVCHELAHLLTLRMPMYLFESTAGLSMELEEVLRASNDHNECQTLAITSLVLERMGAHLLVGRQLFQSVTFAAKNNLGEHRYDRPWAMRTVRRYRRQPCIKQLADLLWDIIDNPQILISFVDEYKSGVVHGAPA
jgi:hypothetical protein